jgi:hypothetical protein
VGARAGTIGAFPAKTKPNNRGWSASLRLSEKNFEKQPHAKVSIPELPSGEADPPRKKPWQTLFRMSERRERDTDCFGISDARPVFIRKKTGACLLRSASSALLLVGHSRRRKFAFRLTMNPRLGIFTLCSTSRQVNGAVGGSQTLIHKASGFLIHKLS